MRNLQVGDKIVSINSSYSFGIADEEYSHYCKNGTNVIVIKTGLNVMKHETGDRDGPCPEVCDILVTDNDGGFWFTQSRFVELRNHIIVIDGKEIEVSEESFRNLKQQLTRE